MPDADQVFNSLTFSADYHKNYTEDPEDILYGEPQCKNHVIKDCLGNNMRDRFGTGLSEKKTSYVKSSFFTR